MNRSGEASRSFLSIAISAEFMAAIDVSHLLEKLEEWVTMAAAKQGRGCYYVWSDDLGDAG